jgi:hypothetical protein
MEKAKLLFFEELFQLLLIIIPQSMATDKAGEQKGFKKSSDVVRLITQH